ncbi:hypothetical protein [Candidatus Protochlamydia sp. R18]|uniref:hypothetical protein n=1 Tax=Candidatus Protochlamydia sp. R18 TaxID=1353977 RepID=UPI0005A5F9DA|nr:hypothetical protein [Candidatus Protochlamydia sp. R18]
MKKMPCHLKGWIMQVARKFVTLTLFFVLVTHSIYGQSRYNQEYEYDDGCDSAYAQSSRTAHWSAYVPIVALIAAGIIWSIADKDHKSYSSHASSSSQDGLGPLDSSSYNYSGYSLGSGYSH